jgi:hypothetical protein
MAAQNFQPAAVLFVLLALSVASRVEAGYCIAPGGCPSYTVVSQNDEFETRNYDASEWLILPATLDCSVCLGFRSMDRLFGATLF